MKEQKCRDCGNPLGIPVEYNKRSGKERVSERCDSCKKSYQKSFRELYKNETQAEKNSAFE